MNNGNSFSKISKPAQRDGNYHLQLFSADERLETGKFSKWYLKEISSVPFGMEKEDYLCIGSLQCLTGFSGKLGCLPFVQKIRKFQLKVKWKGNFCGKSIRKLWTTSRSSPLFLFGTERRQLPYHLLNFPVSSLSSADNNNGKANCKW